MNFTPMSRERANELLYLWKVGAEAYPQHVINRALQLTGDLLPTSRPVVRDDAIRVWRSPLAGGNSDAR